ncbi:MAG: hypothetical protein ACR2G4_13095 [Pyrinomonadaceae bacterium]
MHHMISILLLCLIAVFIQPPDGSKEVFLNRPFDLRVGREVTVKGEKLKLSFRSVAEDSRCPQDVRCIRAGNGQIRVKVSQRNHAAIVKLNTMGELTRISYQGYEVSLINLTPAPRSNRKINKKDYVATFMVSKKEQKQTTGEVKSSGQKTGAPSSGNELYTQLTCLPDDLKPNRGDLPGRDISQERTLKHRLIELKASCREDKLVDDKNREIRFFRLACWGNPPADYQEIQQRQTEELEKLKEQFTVIVIGCPRSLQ